MGTVSSTVEVDVDVTTAYNQWTQFESFPSFMDGVESITQLDGWDPEGLVEKAGAALNFDQRQVDASAKDFKEFIEKRGGQETDAWRGNV